MANHETAVELPDSVEYGGPTLETPDKPGPSGQAVLDRLFSEAGNEDPDAQQAQAAPAAPAAEPAAVEDDDPFASLPKELVAPKKEAAVSAEPSAEDEDKKAEAIAARFTTAEQKQAFFEIRKELKEWKTQAKAALEKVKEAEAAPKTPTIDKDIIAKNEELQAKVEAYEAEIGQLDLERSPSFKQTYDLPMKGIEARLVKRLTNANRSADDAKALAQQLLSVEDSYARIELLGDDPPAIQGAVLNLTEEFSELAENRNVALTNWKQSRAAVEEENRRSAATSFVQNVHKGVEAAAQGLAQEGNFLYTQLEGNADWNAQVAQRVDVAKGILQSGDNDQLIKYVVDGVAAQDLRALYGKLVGAYQKLKADSSKLVASTPSIRASQQAQAARAAEKPKSGKEVLDSIFPDADNIM